MQATLKDRFGVDAELIGGHGGTFLVTLDGDKIYDKLATGRFPEESEVVAAIEKKQR